MLGEKKQELKAKEIVLPLDWSIAVTSRNSNRRHPEIHGQEDNSYNLLT